MTPAMPKSELIEGFRAIVPAGGAGTRLWPLSRAARPKFLLDLTGSGRSLLQATIDRLSPLTGPTGVVVVTGVRHGEAVTEQLAKGIKVLTEPSPRDSMAAIGLAAAVLAETEPDLIVGSFAADHVIGDEAAFRATIRQAVATAREGFLVTVGITATGPSTAFGYIESGAALDISGALDACRVAGFTEKPDAQTAAEYLATGRYRWNAGMFVARVDVLLGHLAEQKPALHDGLREIARVWDTPGRQDALDRIWPGLERISIDHAIAEPVAAAGGVATVPGEFPWNDVGDFAALAAELPEGQVLGDAASVRMLESPGGIVVAGTGRLIATVGLPDVVVVDTPDALLVTTKDRAQQVKDVVDLLRADDRTDLL